MRVVRTDDKNAREKRREHEKLAGIRDIFDSFVQNCQKHYIISEYATIDEKLEAFRGHCSFRQHIASKPNKYNAREKRRQHEKLAGIRDIFDSFVQNCQKHYIISEYATIDEKLEAFRGHCSFRQHIASKPNKYGIKMFALVDEKTYYTYNMEVYVGSSLKENFHKGMTQRVLFYELLSQYQNSMHFDDKIDPDSADATKSSIITFYNKTKSGVDVVDELSASTIVREIQNGGQCWLLYSLLNSTNQLPHFIFLKQLSTRPEGGKRKRCKECVKSDSKTNYYCKQCYKYMCLSHANIYCKDLKNDLFLGMLLMRTLN
ncbi:Transposase IS4 [Popillia japonica]|uniref:Transposase IS4 n=1 Tax=Popillia japonica TaxID=7064 RepID=A0AAW1HFL2_POPJA